MQVDIFGQDVTLNKQDALEAWNETCLGFVSHAGATPKHLVRCLEAAPNFALAHGVKGLFCMLGGQKELVATAASALAAAKFAQDGTPISRRELAYLDALELWLGGQLSGATQRLEQQLRDTPTDALAVKLVHAMRFLVGDAMGMRASIERVLPAYDESHAGLGYVEGVMLSRWRKPVAISRPSVSGDVR